MSDTPMTDALRDTMCGNEFNRNDIYKWIDHSESIERENQQLREELRAANKGAETNAHINLQLIKKKNQLHTALQQCAKVLFESTRMPHMTNETYDKCMAIQKRQHEVLSLPAVQDALKGA